MDQPVSNLKKIAALILVLGALMTGLIFQRRTIINNRRMAETANRNRIIAAASDLRKNQVNPLLLQVSLFTLNQLDEPLLKDAQSNAADFAQLRKERQLAMDWPDLIVPEPKNIRLQVQNADDTLQYRLCEFDDYQRLTNDTGDAKVAGAKFVEAYIRLASSGKTFDFNEVFSLGKTAIEAGSRDPLLRTYFARAKWAIDGDRASAEQAWNEVLEELPKTKYSATVQVYAHSFLLDLSKSDPQSNNLYRWQLLVDSIVKWLEEEAEHPERLPGVCLRLWRIWYEVLPLEQARLIAGCLKSNKVDPYIKLILTGKYYYRIAYGYRGTSYMSDVSKDQLEYFMKYLHIAAPHLQFAWTMHPELPYAQSELIDIAMSDSKIAGASPYFWFVQTIEAQFDDNHAYSSMEMALLPRWGGTHEQMARFARNCFNTNHFETHVPYRMFEVLEKFDNWEDVPLSDNVRAKRLLKEFVAKRNAFRIEHPDVALYGDRSDVIYWTKLYWMLEECGLPDLAAEEVHSIWPNIHWTTLRQQGRPGRYLALRQGAVQGGNRGSLQAFDKKLRQPWDQTKDEQSVADLEEQMQQLKEGTTKPDQMTDAYYRQVDTILSQLRGLSKGEWVKLPIMNDLDGFEPYCDTWNVLEDHAVELSGRWGNAPQLCLRPLANFHPPLEIEGQLETLDPEPDPKMAGIGWSREGMKSHFDGLLSQPLFGIEVQRIQNFQTKEKQRQDIACVKVMVSSTGVICRLSSTKVHQLRLKLWSNRAEYFVDNQAWMSYRISEGLNPEGWLCFGSNIPEWDGRIKVPNGAMRWSDLRIRRLDSAQPPDDSEPLAKRVEYWEQRQSRDPNDPTAASGLCAVRFEQKRFDDVIEIVGQLQARLPEINSITRWKGMAFHDGLHDYSQAFKEFKVATKEYRDDLDVYLRLVEIQAAAPDQSLRNGKEAKRLGQMCLPMGGKEVARVHAALAAAHAELGEWDDAIRVQQDALKLASAEEAKNWEQRLQQYTDHQPFRLSVNEPAH